ncbi:MAG: hypothetical protein K8U57_23330 [Planctomycetes bacterium]|nr:hypothetical protein [Planctomycetota bacterium]
MYCSPRCCALFSAALVLSVSGVGCAPGKGEVTGKVTYNGAPLDKPNGNIVFVSPSGIQVVAPIAADGTYRATDVPRGDTKIAVYYSNPKFPTVNNNQPQRKIPMPNDPSLAVPLPEIPPYLTPIKYASEGTSGFAVKVEANTVFNAELTGPPIK